MENYQQYIVIVIAIGVGLLVYLAEFFWRKKRKQTHLEIQQRRVETFKDIDFLGSNSEPRVKLVDTLFTCFYGIKIQLDPTNDEELEACAKGLDQRCKEAKDQELEIYCDRLTDGTDYFLYIGKSLGSLNLNSSGHTMIEIGVLEDIIKSTNKKLSRLTIDGYPSLHLQASHEY